MKLKTLFSEFVSTMTIGPVHEIKERIASKRAVKDQTCHMRRLAKVFAARIHGVRM